MAKRKKLKVYPIWPSRSQGSIPINEMEDIHLVNAINYLERKALDLRVKMAEKHDTERNIDIMDIDAAEFFPILKAMRKLATERRCRFDVTDMPVWSTGK